MKIPFLKYTSRVLFEETRYFYFKVVIVSSNLNFYINFQSQTACIELMWHTCTVNSGLSKQCQFSFSIDEIWLIIMSIWLDFEWTTPSASLIILSFVQLQSRIAKQMYLVIVWVRADSFQLPCALRPRHDDIGDSQIHLRIHFCDVSKGGQTAVCKESDAKVVTSQWGQYRSQRGWQWKYGAEKREGARSL